MFYQSEQAPDQILEVHILCSYLLLASLDKEVTGWVMILRDTKTKKLVRGLKTFREVKLLTAPSKDLTILNNTNDEDWIKKELIINKFDFGLLGIGRLEITIHNK